MTTQAANQSAEQYPTPTARDSAHGLFAAMREARDRMNCHQSGSDQWWIALYDLQKAEQDYNASLTGKPISNLADP